MTTHAQPVAAANAATNAAANPRSAAISSMYEHAAALAAAGDLAGARELHATIGRMLGSAEAGAVVDLASRRR